MSNPYAGADDFPATIPVLDDADPPEAATWAPALEGLADRTVYLLARQFPGGIVSVAHTEQTPASETTVLENGIDDSGLYVNLASMSGLSLSNTEDLDLLVTWARVKLLQVGTGTGQVGIQITRNGTAVPGARTEADSVQNQVHELFVVSAQQLTTAAPPETLRVQAVSTGLDVDVIGSFSFFAMAIRINP